MLKIKSDLKNKNREQYQKIFLVKSNIDKTVYVTITLDFTKLTMSDDNSDGNNDSKGDEVQGKVEVFVEREDKEKSKKNKKEKKTRKKKKKKDLIEPDITDEIDVVAESALAPQDFIQLIPIGQISEQKPPPIIIPVVRKRNREGSSNNSPKDPNRITHFSQESQERQAKRQKIDEEAAKVNEEINRNDDTSLTLNNRILLSNHDIKTKALAVQNLKHAGHPNSSDYSKWVKWINNLLRIPVGVYRDIPVKISQGPIVIDRFLAEQKEQLDRAVYGLEEVKEEIISFIAQKISNPNSKGTVLALQGSPGIGKTRIARLGIAKALNRYFGTVNMGGMKDPALLDGHDFTYVGAKYGRIVQILINGQHMDPVVYLDEFDKVPEYHAEGVNGLLTHLLDEEQNHDFQDNYFQGVSLDLSKVLFVLSFNDPNKISEIARNRMKIIKIPPPSIEEKVIIAQKYMLPEITMELGLFNNDIVLGDEEIKYLITVKTDKEDGMRRIKKNLERICQKLNILRLKGDSNYLKLSYTDKFSTIKFPFKVTTQDIDILLKNSDEDKSHQMMYL